MDGLGENLKKVMLAGVGAVAVTAEKSKELLTGTAQKTYQISKAVGYDNPKYFFRIFKKKTGITPEQFRILHQ